VAIQPEVARQPTFLRALWDKDARKRPLWSALGTEEFDDSARTRYPQRMSSKEATLRRFDGQPVLLFVLGSMAGCAGENSAPASGKPLATDIPTATSEAPSAGLTPGGSAGPGASASAAPAGAAAPADLNVLMISIDALRSDHMAFSGHNPEVMPTLNAFEKTAVSYTKFRALSSFTSQTLGGFLGCRYPSELMRSGSFFGAYPDAELLFPELLQKAGVRTMSAHAHFYFAKDKSNFQQGFDQYEIVPGLKKSNTTDENISSPAHTEIALKHLADKANTGGRFFAWYHLLDAHDQYMTHETGKSFGKSSVQKYDGELYFVDQHVKKIFDFVDAEPWGKRTMIIVTADHGEAFGEHKQYRHGFELWDTVIHVPLMIRAPGVAPRRVDEPRGMIDLCPTILESFGVKPEAGFQGTSLWPELRGEKVGPRDVISDLSRTSDNDRRRTLLRGDYKLIELGDGDGYQLFNVAKDPGELDDLSKKEKPMRATMIEAMKASSKTIKEICPKRRDHLVGKKPGKDC